MRIKLVIIILIFFLVPLIGQAQEFDDLEEFGEWEDEMIEAEEAFSDDIPDSEVLVESYYLNAKAIKIQDLQIKEDNFGVTDVVSKEEVTIKITSKRLNGKEFKVINEITSNPLNLEIKENDKLLVNIEEYKDGSTIVYLIDHGRISGILLLVALFLALLVIVGGKQGQKTVISLIVSIFLIFKVLIPKILDGSNPTILALLISVLIVIVTLVLIAGFSKKSLIAILGTLGGLIIAIWVSYVFSKILYLTGLSTEEARILFNKHSEIDPQGIFFAGIIIGALGAVMDVSMSIASSLNEICLVNKKIGFSGLFKAGMRVGKDIMGTMSNTLIFAYVGASLPLLLLFSDYGGSYLQFINFSFISDEIIRSLSGSIGLITVIPITALIGATLYSKDN